MRSGPLRNRVILSEKIATQNDHGEEQIIYTEIVTVWASIEPLRGREYIEARQGQAELTHRVRIRFPGTRILARINRVTFGARTFEINAVQNQAERRRLITLMTTENQHASS